MSLSSSQRKVRLVGKSAGRNSNQKPDLKTDKKNRIRKKVHEAQAIQMQMAELLQNVQEKVRQLEGLTAFSSVLNSTLDTSIVREKALEATCQLLSCETASLFLVDPQTGELYWETALGEVGKKLQSSVRLPINDQSIAGYVAMTGEAMLINDVKSDPRHFKGPSPGPLQAGEGPTSFQVQTMLCVPLKSKDRIVGVLQALNKLPTVPLRPSQHSWPDFVADDLKLLVTLAHQVAIAVENSRLYSQLKSSFYDTVEALAEAIEKKDRYTGGHTKRVVHYSLCIAKYLSLTAEELDRVRLGAILHDVGKIGIEDKILKKPAALDPYEWPVMRTHPEMGYEIMQRVEGLKDVVAGMRFHHERWDGKGYPLGLKGEEIPLMARIISVADTYDAMVSTRPYRKGLEPQVAFEEILQNAGTQFCPTVVEAFKKAFENEKMGRGSGGSSLKSV